MDARLEWPVLPAVTISLLLVAVGLGRRTERAAAAACVVAWIATVASHRLWPDARPIAAAVVVDTLLLAVFARLAWKASHPWVAWATGVQAVALALHLAYVQAPDAPRGALVAAQTVTRLAMALLTAWGAVAGRRRREL